MHQLIKPNGNGYKAKKIIIIDRRMEQKKMQEKSRKVYFCEMN